MKLIDGRLVRWQVNSAHHVGCVMVDEEGDVISYYDGVKTIPANDDELVLVKEWPTNLLRYVAYGLLEDRKARAD